MGFLRNRLRRHKNNTKNKLNEKEGVRGRKRTISRSKNVKSHFLSFGATFLLHPLAGADECHVQSVSSRGSGKCCLRKLLKTIDTPPPLFSRCAFFWLTSLDTALTFLLNRILLN
ncbi:hypothetical protein CDAR_301771 [Caerostris darwini]|uniref:Uncharacterized protein n=1 Tax=Caerostris darwini TaxID=1538125 RepID=A0AAV4VDV2_9ARAC|nr:hypothetical protein CDAR_301771 [Caerostris darwini]